MNITPSHQSAIVVTPATLKHQIITRMNTLVGKYGGSYYPTDDNGYTKPLAVIEGMEVHGIETKGRDVYLMCVPTDETIAINSEDGVEPYNANEFYLEQLWEAYLGCEPIYVTRFNDYANFQE